HHRRAPVGELHRPGAVHGERARRGAVRLGGEPPIAVPRVFVLEPGLGVSLASRANALLTLTGRFRPFTSKARWYWASCRFNQSFAALRVSPRYPVPMMCRGRIDPSRRSMRSL